MERSYCYLCLEFRKLPLTFHHPEKNRKLLLAHATIAERIQFICRCEKQGAAVSGQHITIGEKKISCGQTSIWLASGITRCINTSSSLKIMPCWRYRDRKGRVASREVVGTDSPKEANPAIKGEPHLLSEMI